MMESAVSWWRALWLVALYHLGVIDTDGRSLAHRVRWVLPILALVVVALALVGPETIVAKLQWSKLQWS